MAGGRGGLGRGCRWRSEEAVDSRQLKVESEKTRGVLGAARSLGLAG